MNAYDFTRNVNALKAASYAPCGDEDRGRSTCHPLTESRRAKVTDRTETRRISAVVAAWACSLTLTVTVVLAQQETPMVCDKPPVEPCAVRHGRLTSRQGVPFAIWLIGTNRMIAVDNSPESFLSADSNRYLEVTSPDYSEMFGDFTICPLEPDQPRHMRRACVTLAKNLVVHHLKDQRPPFRVLSSWSTEASPRRLR